jgi:putative ABC transport system ATP-binding protein
MLELQEASKRYESPGEIVHAVEDVTLNVRAGELVAVFGPSGSGKSTLLLLAAGLLKPDAGTILYEGRDLAGMSKRELLGYRRTQLGFVFQGFNLAAGLTARENVSIALLTRGVDHATAEERAELALREVGVAHRAGHPPDRLSGGEQQRVAIARALVGEPRLVLADEPTGSLDSDTGNGVLDLLSSLPRERGVGTVLVTHDSAVTRYADRVLNMRDGRLCGDGVDRPAAALTTE